MDRLPFITNACPKCGGSMSEEEVGVCFDCKTKNFHFEQAVSVFEYAGKIVKAIHDFKFSNVKPNFEPLAEFMCETLAGWGVEPDIVTFVPMTKKKQKQRGFNQAELLARNIAANFDYPCAAIVEKVKENLTQSSLDYKSRQENIKDCFEVRSEYRKIIKGTTILLIDDIFTTGATSNEVSRVLKCAGAEKVYVLTLAHTNSPRRK